jgi:LytTr DNA-binding domain
MRIDGANGEFGDQRWWARALSFATGVGVLLGVIGPFGIYMNPLPLRMVDSIGMAIAAAAIAGLLIPIQLRAGLRIGLPLWFMLAVSLAVTAFPVAGLGCVAAHLLWPRHVADLGPTDWYFQTLLMLSCVFGLWLLLEVARDRAFGYVDAEAPHPHAPMSFGPNGVVCLQTEDNYVRIHSMRGSRLELMPLHEAIERFGDAEGLQVHRGWWVAASAVETAEREGRNWRLRLKNGLRAPIARNRVANVRALGWLDHTGL